MTQMGFMLDQKYCIGCQTCQHACRVRHGVEPGTYPRKATSSQVEVTGPYISIACNHCEDPACLSACPTGAISKRDEDGVVVHDPDKCIGCYMCKMACPYDAPQENTKTGTMVKCDMCAARIDNGEEPACVQACPVKVLTYGPLDELEKEGGVKEGVGFKVESTKPSMRFIPIS